MAKRQLTPGDDTEARCTRCREVTNHTIVAMVEGRVARVQCHICDGVHNYHAPAPAPRAGAPRVPAVRPAAKEPKQPRGRAAAAAAADLADWQAAVTNGNPDAARPYAMTASFRTGELLRHPSFGIGLVKSVLPGKMEVLFETGRKLLRSA